MANLSAQLFPHSPASMNDVGNRYFQSYGYYRFRLVLPELRGLLSKHQYVSRDLSHELRNADLLGPYETQALSELLFAEKGLILSVGSAGSGKSSSLRYVLEFYDKNKNVPPPTSSDTLVDRLRASTFNHVLLDFNEIAEEVKDWVKRYEPTKVEDMLLAELPAAIQAALLASLSASVTTSSLGPDELLMRLIRVVTEWCIRPQGCLPAFKRHRSSVLRVLTKLGASYDANDFLSFVSALESTCTPRRQLDLWFGVMEAISLLSAQQHGRFFLLLDNLDPLPEFLQLFIKRKLLDLLQDRSFRCILPVRISTAIRPHEATFSRVLTWYPHCGPSPLDVVTMRLLAFLARPDDFSAYKALSDEQQRRKSCRAFELLLRLHRGRGQYRSLGRVLSATAGDSIRRAFHMMSYLFDAERLDDSYDAVLALNANLADIRRRYELRMLLERIGTIVLEELTSIAEEIDFSNLAEDEERWAARSSRRIIAAIKAILENLSTARGETLSELHVRELEDVCTRELAGRACRQQVQLGWMLVADSALRQQVHADIMSKFRDDIVRALRMGLEEPLRKTLGPADVSGKPVIDLICRGLQTESVKSSLGHFQINQHEDDELSASFEWEKSGYCREILRVHGPHKATWALIESNFVADLLHDAKGRVCSGKARILYALAAEPASRMGVGRLLDLLALCGYTKDDVHRFVNDLVNQSVRAVWVNKSFGYQSYADIKKDCDTTIRLTRGGWGLICTVLGELNYATTVLTKGRPRPRGHEDYLSVVVEELEALFNKDRVIFKRLLNEERQLISRGTLLRQNSIAVEVAVRCAPEVIWSCRSHFARLMAQGARERMQRTRNAVMSWYSFIRRGWLRQVAMIPAGVLVPVIGSPFRVSG